MYLNQFTNTKNSVQALSLHMTNVYSGYMLGKTKNTFQQFFFYKNDMRYIIPYSFSQQNEFYKVYNTKKEKKKKRQKKEKNNGGGGSQFHKTVLTLQHQYLCRSIYTSLKNIHPLRRIYHNYLQLTGESRKLQNLPIMLLGHHRIYFQWLQWHERCSFYSQVFTRSIQTGKFL